MKTLFQLFLVFKYSVAVFYQRTIIKEIYGINLVHQGVEQSRLACTQKCFRLEANMVYHGTDCRCLVSDVENVTFAHAYSLEDVDYFQFISDITMEHEDESSTPGSPPAHLLIYLTYDDVSGKTVIDNTTYGNDATMSGNCAIVTTVLLTCNPSNHVIQFNSGSGVVIPGRQMVVIPTNAISVALWVRFFVVMGEQPIFATVGKSYEEAQYLFNVIDGGVNWSHQNEAKLTVFNVSSGKNILHPLEWHHITAIYNTINSKAIIYINGTMVTQGTGSGVLSQDWKKRVRIGRNEDETKYLNGKMDELQLYDTALSEGDVKLLVDKCV